MLKMRTKKINKLLMNRWLKKEIRIQGRLLGKSWKSMLKLLVLTYTLSGLQIKASSASQLHLLAMDLSV